MSTLSIIGKYTQTATYWGAPTNDGSGGLSFAAPAAITVRWEQFVENKHDPEGEEFVSQARVFTQQDLEIGGYLLLGTSVEADPTQVAGAFKIRIYQRRPTVDALHAERMAVL